MKQKYYEPRHEKNMAEALRDLAQAWPEVEPVKEKFDYEGFTADVENGKI